MTGRIKLSISVMAHPSRSEFFPYLEARLGTGVPFSIDRENNLLKNSKSAWRMFDPTADFHVVIQDDCIICDNFYEKAVHFISEMENKRLADKRPPQGYNFFLKSDHAGRLPRYGGGYFIDNCTRAGLAICLPTSMILPMLDEFDRQFSRHDDDRISEFLRKHKYNVIFPEPSLIDHRIELESLAGNVVGCAAYNFIDRAPVTIPKIIHQLWVGPKPRPDKWMRSWMEMHPTWEYRVWDNNAIRATKWINQKHVDYYLERGLWPGVSDVCTYEILFNHGGFMPGADSICQLPVDELFTENYDAYSVYEQEEIRPGLISPLHAAVKGSLFAKELIDGLTAKKEVGEPWLTVGNKYMGEMYAKTRQNVKIFPSHYFNPEHFTGKKYEGHEKVFARQMWGTTRNTYDRGITNKKPTVNSIMRARHGVL